MTEILSITSYVLGASLTGLISWIGGWLLARNRYDSARESGITMGVQTLLKAELSRIHATYIEASPQPPCPQSVAGEADDVYHAYKALGGNGRGTVMWDEIMHAHAKQEGKKE